MSEENQELAFDEMDNTKLNDQDNEEHYRRSDIARINISAKEVDGLYIKNVGSTKAELIKVLKEVLGTMVQEPEFTKDPNDIGGKPVFKMYIQKPIIEGDNRTKVVNKLVELIDSL